MKTIFRFLLLVFSVFTSMSSLFSQWVQTNGPGSPVTRLTVLGTDLYAGTTTARGNGGVYLSTAADPSNWTPFGLQNRDITGLGVSNSVLFAGTSQAGAFRDSGGVWNPLGNGIPGVNDTYIISFTSQDNYIFAGSFLLGAYRSSNGGDNWVPVNTGLQAFPTVQCFALNGNNLFLGTSDSGVYRSTNYGALWTPARNGLSNGNVYALAVIDTILFASVPGGGGLSFSIYRSMNNGANWDLVNTQGQPPINQFAVSGRNIFGVALGAGVYLSTDLGTTWNPVNNGLPNGLTILSIAVRGSYLYVGSSYTATTNGFVYYRPLAEMVTDVHETGDTPTAFTLEQNYPNPFNPTTTIAFSVFQSGYVNLEIFNLLGEAIRPLISENLNAGTYKAAWDASAYPSGVYFYRLQAGTFSETKRLLLIW